MEIWERICQQLTCKLKFEIFLLDTWIHIVVVVFANLILKFKIALWRYGICEQLTCKLKFETSFLDIRKIQSPLYILYFHFKEKTSKFSLSLLMYVSLLTSKEIHSKYTHTHIYIYIYIYTYIYYV
jgi:hypothetical protein